MTLQLTRAPRDGGSARRGGRLVLRILGLVVLVAACWGTLLAALPGHIGDPVLVSTTPTAGTVVKTEPEVRLDFDRPVPAGLATIRITDPSGTVLPTERPYNPADQPDSVAVAAPKTMYQGSWTVAWAVPTDGKEPVSGYFEFHVWAPGPQQAPADVGNGHGPVLDVVSLVAVALATAAATVGTGLVLVLAVAWPAGIGRRAVVRTVRWSGGVLLVAGVTSFELYAVNATGAPLSQAFDPALLTATARSGIGGALLLRIVLLLPLALGAWQLLTAAPAERVLHRWLAGATVLGASSAMLATFVAAQPHGHGRPSVLGTAAGTLLFVSLAVSVGGSVALWMVLRWARESVVATVGTVARLLPWGAGALLLSTVVTVGGWQRVAYAVVAVLVSVIAVAARRWVARTPDGADVPSRPRMVQPASVAVAAVLLALVGAAVAPAEPGQALVDLSAHAQPAQSQGG